MIAMVQGDRSSTSLSEDKALRDAGQQRVFPPRVTPTLRLVAGRELGRNWLGGVDTPEQLVGLGGIGLGVGNALAHATSPHEVPRVEERFDGPTGLVDAFIKTSQRWLLNVNQQATLLGYKNNETGALSILFGRMRIPSQDVRDRITYLLGISITLGRLFGEDPNKELAWLRSPRKVFEKKSAIDLLLTGSMANLLLVWSYVRTELDR